MERLTEEARRAARQAHQRAEEALQKERLAEEAERRAAQLAAQRDQKMHQLAALRAKVRMFALLTWIVMPCPCRLAQR